MACSPRPTEPRVGRTSTPAPPSAPRIVGDYAVAYDGVGELRVEAKLDGAGAVLTIDRGAEGFVSGFEVSAAEGDFRPGEKRGTSFVAAACAKGPCRIRYRFALREACRKIDDVDVASEEGEVLEAPPSTWLLAPEEASAKARIRFHVATPSRFVTGVFRSGDGWEISLEDLWTSPYTAFGPLRVYDVPANAKLQLAIIPGKMSVDDATLVAWTANAARAVTGYCDRFPLPEALVIAVPARGRWVGFGKALGGGGGSILVRVGESAKPRAFESDWVLVHEMIHLAFPSVPREQSWAEEGLATYVEPLARARAGMISPESAWDGLRSGIPNGLPGPGDRGLDRTPTWGRTYWGGALFYLLADLEIRKATQNRLGLEHAVRGILAAGGSNAHRWSLEDTFAAADRAIGQPILGKLHAAMGTNPHPVDLAALWRELGIVPTQNTVRLDDSAPLAELRRATTAPP